MKQGDTTPQGRSRNWLRRCVGWAVRLIAGSVLLVLAALFAWAVEDRNLPDLEAWHHAPKGEFRAHMADGEFAFTDYLAIEERLFAQVEAMKIPAERASLYMRHSRFQPGGPSDPDGFERNWNHSVELVPDTIRGGALLLHGLSDSPYSLRTLAESLHARGIYVLCLRLPGHGTAPAGLLDVHHEDWRAAVDVAARHVVQRAGAGPFYVAGFSCGGALATQLAADAVLDPSLTVPDHVFLFSPAIGITGFARASNWHVVYSWMPWFEKSKWLAIEPEYDPYKYNSFTKNAGDQMWLLTQAVQADLQAIEDAGKLADLPPFLAFQSVVDATIVAEDLVRHLYGRLPGNGSELVVFDVNDRIFLEGLYATDPRAVLERLETDASAAYRFTVITNRDSTESAVVARSRAPHAPEPTTTALDLDWPADVYSLSHVAIPLPPDDPFYGIVPAGDAADRRISLGRVALRGENDVLRVAASQMLRLRANPFHPFLMRRIEEAVDAKR